MSILHAIIVLVLFFGGYVIYKRMFPTIEHIFDIYIAVWIVILLTVGAKDAIFLFR